MFVVLKGFHTMAPGEVCYVIAEVGSELSPKFTTTAIVAIEETQREAFYAACDIKIAA